MSGKQAKRIRRLVYGKGHHPGPVQYARVEKTGQIIADRWRMEYQEAKGAYVGGRT